MTIATCPACHEEVRVPPQASDQATVECPWCGNQGELGELMKASPPLLLVVNDPGVESTASMPFTIETGERADAPRFDFEERDAPQAQPVSAVTRSVGSRRPRPQPKGGGIISAVAVIFGGLCALPLAQLCLWWIFNRDPIDLGPKVSPYAAFLVPTQFRGHAPHQPSLQPPADNASNGMNLGKTGLPQSPFGAGGRPIPNSPAETAANGSGAGENDGDVGGGFGSEVPDGTSGADSMLPIERPEPFAAFPVTEDAEITDALTRVLTGFETWASAESLSDQDRPALLQEFYNGYGQLGEKLAFADARSPEAQQWLGLVDSTLRSQLTDEQLLRFLGNKAKQKLDQPLAGTTGGIALAGRCESIERDGAFWKIRVRMGESKPKMVDVMAWLPPPKTLAKGNQVIVLGCRLADVEPMGWEAKDSVEPILGGYLTILEPESR
jgi:hypothetical protein